MAKGAGGKKKRCGKGKSCGASCIFFRKLCLIELPLAPRLIGGLRGRLLKRKRPDRTPTAIPKAQVSPPTANPKGAPPDRTPTAIPKAQVSPPTANPKGAPPQVPGTRLDARKVSEKLRGTLPGFDIKTPSPYYLELERNIDGNKLKISLSDRTLQFTVNGKTTSESLPKSTSLKIAVAVHSATSKLMRALPNGTILDVKAETSDGKGAKRAKWFEREGFSKPPFVGGPQIGKVIDGKLTPFNTQQGLADSARPEYRERMSRASSIAGWYFILFGDYPEKRER